MTEGDKKRSRMAAYLGAMRPSQWTKNAIIFAAFFFALGDKNQDIAVSDLWVVLGAAVVFCLVSSGIYLLNDVKDIDLDRAHPVKRHRPIAAGEVPVAGAVVLAVILLSAGLLGSTFLNRDLLYVAATYVVLQIVYTLALKRVALIDLLVIAAGFVLRALAGALVIKVDISPWLLVCTFWLALFLALCKRRHEKVVLTDAEAETRPSLESYHERLLDQLIAIVSSATIVSYALYTLWPDTVEKFGTTRLGFTIPFVLFGLFRYLDLVYRHEKGDKAGEDPSHGRAPHPRPGPVWTGCPAHPQIDPAQRFARLTLRKEKP